MAEETPSKPKPTGKTFNFNLIGDDLFLYETVRELYEADQEEADATVAEALAGLGPATRALVEARFAPKAKKELSHRQVFVQALRESLKAREAAEDARAAAELIEEVAEEVGDAA